MSIRISVFNSKELQGVILAMKGFDRELAKEIRQQTKKVIQPVWQEAVRGRSQTALEVRVLGSTARAQISSQNVTLTSAASVKKLSGGGTPDMLWPGTEFGSDNYKQFKGRNRKGYVVWQAAADVIPRIASLWVQTVVRTFYETYESGLKK